MAKGFNFKLISIKQNIHGIDPNLLLQIYKSFDLMSIKKLILSRKWEDKIRNIPLSNIRV
jgi:hypothetical protein